jgi:hypothetical protein
VSGSVCTGAQLALGEGLLQVVDRAEVEAADLHGVVAARGHEDDRDVARVRVGADPVERLETVHAGHEEVHEDDVRVLGARDVHARLAVLGGEHLVVRREEEGERLARVGVVVHHEDPRLGAGDAAGARAGSRLGGARARGALELLGELREPLRLLGPGLVAVAGVLQRLGGRAQLRRRGRDERVLPERALAQPAVGLGELAEAGARHPERLRGEAGDERERVRLRGGGDAERPAGREGDERDAVRERVARGAGRERARALGVREVGRPPESGRDGVRQAPGDLLRRGAERVGEDAQHRRDGVQRGAPRSRRLSSALGHRDRVGLRVVIYAGGGQPADRSRTPRPERSRRCGAARPAPTRLPTSSVRRRAGWIHP